MHDAGRSTPANRHKRDPALQVRNVGTISSPLGLLARAKKQQFPMKMARPKGLIRAKHLQGLLCSTLQILT
jgi:hypothetical protein